MPAALVPKPYDYKRPVAHLLKAGDDAFECSICMGDIDADQGAEEPNHSVTPCDHVFHDICLSQWMDLKMECPVCRAPLPPVVGPDDDDAAADHGDSPPEP